MHQEIHENISLNCWVSNFTVEHYDNQDKTVSTLTGY